VPVIAGEDGNEGDHDTQWNAEPKVCGPAGRRVPTNQLPIRRNWAAPSEVREHPRTMHSVIHVGVASTTDAKHKETGHDTECHLIEHETDAIHSGGRGVIGRPI